MEAQPLTFGCGSSKTHPEPHISHLDFTATHDLSTSSLKGIGKKLQTDEDLQPYYLRPRFDGEPLQRLLQSFVNKVLDIPIQYYESLLYNSTKTYVDTLGGMGISLNCLCDMHQIYSLKQHEQTLSPIECVQLNDSLEVLLEDKPMVFEEYKLIRNLNELICGLIVHFGLFTRQKYEYRWQPRVLNLRTLDLTSLNSRLQSMDTLWIAVVADRPPMNALISETTRQLAMVLVSATDSLIRFALRLNATDFRSQPRIDNYLVTKSERLRELLHVEGDYFSPPPKYQELSIPSSFLSKCFKSRAQKKLEILRELLSDQEFAFRAFEEAVLANFVI